MTTGFLDVTMDGGFPNSTVKMNCTTVEPTNSTQEEEDHVFNIISACAWIITVLLILLLNILCLIILSRVKEFHDATKIFLKSMTVGDLVLGLFFYLPMIGVSFAGRKWPFGGLCFVQAWMIRQGLPAYSLSLLLVTIDRYIAVVYPLKYKNLLTRRRAKVTVFIVWILTNIYALVSSIKANWKSSYNPYLFVCTYDEPENEFAAFLQTILSMAIVLIIILMYIRILIIARSQAALIASQHPLVTINGELQSPPPMNRKSFTTIFIVTMTLFLGWLPSLVMGFMNKSQDIAPQVRVASQILLASVSWLNVIIYYVRNRAFREAGQTFLRRTTRNCCGLWNEDNNNFGQSYEHSRSSRGAQA
ncbi:beta-2 adrenergic receptor-like [Patiria miniata]|uniref:G-protein coupled receptors family 1 profile domain-containing protein n=1 Tax=Patiria miniata TaxID=46514 RepID=A0A913ZVL2_PATMI|nr:beta-2 adrenergic receptor-like [Patiria miniata]